jgi:hypothetical protein
MPTFETNTDASTAAAERLAAAQEFRPKKRDWKGNLDETFDPEPIPPEVKKAIDERVNGIMRQCRGPDETMFAVREGYTTVARILARMWRAIVGIFTGRRKEEDEDDGDWDEPPRSSEGSRTPQAGWPSNSNSHRQERRGKNRPHGHRGGGEGKGGQRDWRENSY